MKYTALPALSQQTPKHVKRWNPTHGGQTLIALIAYLTFLMCFEHASCVHKQRINATLFIDTQTGVNFNHPT